jgi:hypothetical protein
MTADERREELKKLEQLRGGTRVIAYLTGDRGGAETRIGMDVFPYFYEVLSRIGKVEKIDLVLYSTGGLTMAAWGLTNLIREYCKRFSVLVPFKAHSTATLLALGADEIVMGPMGQLSPVDPTITSPFNPMGQNPAQPGHLQLIPVSVEDVASYLNLAREEAEIKAGPGMLEVFKKLSDTVQPMALGQVYRAKEQIKLLASQLLAFHMDPVAKKKEIDTIVKRLTKELYSHDYIIGRREAKKVIALDVTQAEGELEKQLWKCFKSYSTVLELDSPYNPDIALGVEAQKTVEIEGAFIESTDDGFVYRTRKLVRRLAPGQIPAMPQAVGFQEQILGMGWSKI